MKQYTHIFDALVNGQIIEVERGCEWNKYGPTTILGFIQGGVPPELFRIAPKTININGHEVPEPVREPLGDGCVYYIPAFDNTRLCTFCSHWSGDSIDLLWLSRGLIHLTPEAAEAHAKALLSFTQIKE